MPQQRRMRPGLLAGLRKRENQRIKTGVFLMTTSVKIPRLAQIGWVAVCTRFLSLWFAVCCLPGHAQGTAKTDIVIGQTADFSGPLAGNVKEGTQAVRAYFEKVNKSGGVNGRKLVLESLDDGYDPKKTIANARTLIDDRGAIALTLGRGTANAEAVMPLLLEKKVPMVGFAGGSVAMHTPPNRYLFNLRPPYRVEAERAVGQLLAQGITSIATVYTDDAFGKDAVLGVYDGMKAGNLTLSDALPLERGSVNVTAAVARIAATKPGAVIAICTVKPCVALRQGLHNAGYFGTFLTLSNTSSAAFVKDLGPSGRGVIVTQVFPAPQSAALAVSSEFQKLADEYKFAKSYTAMEGYVYARVLVEAIKRAGPGLTSESLTKTLESGTKFDLGGFAVGFTPDNRTGSNTIDLTIITRDGRFMR
jgi:branched-chain amino acid transport system substrate-binding protein